MIDQLGPVAIIGVVLGVVYLAGGKAAKATESAFAGYFRGYQADPWPHGVQEEYIQRHWDRTAPSSNRTTGASRRDVERPPSRPVEEPAEVWTLMRPPRIPVQPIRDFRLESHV